MRALLLLWCLLLPLQACVEADFAAPGDGGASGLPCTDVACDAGARDGRTSTARDGGDDTSMGPAAPDAAVPVPNGSALSAEARAMVGKYAVRARFYARGMPEFFTFAHDIVMRADIHPDAANTALVMDVFLCQDACTIKGPAIADSYSAISNPDRWPTRTYGLQVAGNKFYTTGPALAVGYSAGTPPGCENGAASAPASVTQQSWLSSGQCDCPAANAAPPKSLTDCRVIDGDNDGRAAISLDLTASDGNKQTVLLRMLESSQIIDGVLSADGRHTARYNKGEDYWVLKCESPPCLNSEYRYCPTALQPVLFEPLSEADFTCQTVQARAAQGTLFDRAPLQFPSGC